MKKNVIFLMVSILFFLTSCVGSSDRNSTRELSYSWSTLRLSTKGNSLGASNRAILYLDDSTEYYSIYNEVNSTLLLFNLDSNRFESRVSFFSSGSNKVDFLSEYGIFDDIIWNMSSEGLCKINFRGEIESCYQPQDLCSSVSSLIRFQPKGVVFGNNIRMYSINRDDPRLVLRTFNYDNTTSSFYSNPVFIDYNLRTGNGICHSVKYPDELNSNYYASLELPNIIVKGDSIIYNFPFVASVFIYSKKNKTTVRKDFNAKYIEQVIPGKDIALRGDVNTIFSFMDCEMYHQIDYDPYRNLFYMVYSQAKQDDSPKNRYLIVFNPQLEKIGELELEQSMSPEYAISQKGLLFRNVKEESFDTLTLHVLSVEVE
ncbi:MAG: hypothetical protein JW783_02310 [Bacteroidales bacterium]|nr:hypothetical protein [Bacteroidales bacterium]MBN2750851.1 hypothetical protein [Bacteroidales bacterium]